MNPDDEGADARPRPDPWLEEEQRRNPFDALPGRFDAEGDDDEMAPDFEWPENATEQDDGLNPVEEAWGSGIYERGRQRTREKAMHRSSSRHSRVRHKDEAPRKNYWIQPRYRKLIFRVSTACGVAWVLVATAAIASVVFYVTVYTQYVPGSIEVQVPLYLDYEPETGIRPSAVVKLGQADQQWTLAGPASEDVSLIPTGLAKAQLYDVSVQFSIREVDMGNFMISSELLGHLDKILATSKRPALAHRRLEPVSRSWLGWIFNSRESLEDLKGVPVNLKVDLFERYTELSEPVDRIQSIRITLSTPAVQVFDASVKFQCRLTGFVWYMYHWRITSFLVFMTVVCTIEAVLAYSMVLVFGVTSAIVTFAEPDDADMDLLDHGQKHGKRRERTSRSRHRDD